MNRRTVAGVSLVASPALHLTSSLFWPAGSEGSTATQVATAAAHPGALATASLIEAAGWVILLPGLIGLWNELRGRGSALISLGVWTTALGVVAFVAGAILNLATIDLAHTSHGVTALAAIQQDPRIIGAVVLPILLGHFGLIILLIGVARAGLGGWWMPLTPIVALVGDQLTATTGTDIIRVATTLPLCAAVAVLGLRLIAARPVHQRPRTPATTAA